MANSTPVGLTYNEAPNPRATPCLCEPGDRSTDYRTCKLCRTFFSSINTAMLQVKTQILREKCSYSTESKYVSSPTTIALTSTRVFTNAVKVE